MINKHKRGDRLWTSKTSRTSWTVYRDVDKSKKWNKSRTLKIYLFVEKKLILRGFFRRLYVKISIVKCFLYENFYTQDNRDSWTSCFSTISRIQWIGNFFFFFFFLHGNGIGETFENKKDGIVKNYQGKLCNRFENSADSCSKKILFERRETIFSSRSRFHDSCFLSLFSFFF